MPRPSSPTDADPAPPGRLESLRQSLASVLDSNAPAPPAATSASSTRDMNAASSGLLGANDGEFVFTSLGSSESVVFIPGGVIDDSPSYLSPPITEGSLVGMDPSLYSLDSAYDDVSITREQSPPLLASVHQTPLRTNVSSSAGVGSYANAVGGGTGSPAEAKRVAIVGGSVGDETTAQDPADEFSIVSGITTGTSATVRGVRGVAQSFTAGLFSSLETPGRADDDAKRPPSILQRKTPYKTPVAEVRAESPTFDAEDLKSLSIGSPKVPPKTEPDVGTAPAGDPSACRAWLYLKADMPDLCLGSIGKKGLVCVNTAGECPFNKHKSHKTQLKDNTWYLLTKGEAVQISPSLSNDIARTSSLWSMYERQQYSAANWTSIFNWVRSNAVATSPSELLTEADSVRLLQKGPIPVSTVPKTPKLLKPALRGTEGVPKEEFVEGVKMGFKTAEATLADVYAELAKLASRVGVPSDPSSSHGSCHGDIEAVRMFVTSLEESLATAQKTLQSHQAAFQKCEQNFGSYGKSIDQAVASSLAASQAAQDARNVVQVFQSTGTVNKVSVHDQNIESLQKELSIFKGELTGVYDLVKKLIAQLPTMSSAGGSAAVNDAVAAMKAELGALRSHTTSQLKVMKQSLEGHGPVSLGSFRFDSAEACAAQLAAWGITTSIHEYLFDPFHLLAALLYRSKTHKEVSEQAVLTMKTTLTASQITSIASYETSVPEIFSGTSCTSPGVESSKLTSVFAAIKTYDLFDAGDGETGVLNYVRHNLRDFLPQQHQEAESLFGVTNPGFLTFIDLLRDRSASALEDLFKEMGELYRNLLARACGHCTSYTQVQKAEAWQQVLILLQVYCHEVSKVRAGARNLGNYRDANMANSLAMWSCLSALRIHDVFQRNLYREHPRIAPKLTGYILSTVLRRGELAPVEDRAQRAATEAQRATAAAARAESQLAALRSEYDRFISSFNQWKRTLKVDGADAFPKKAKKQRRNGGNQADDGNAGESGD